jgi:tetratricopeptide (TPR) repeat protein
LIRSISFWFILLFVLVAACAPERNTATSNAFHNTTAHYNGYYYAREEIAKIDAALWDGQQDDHNRVLNLYPRLDSTTMLGFDKQIQEAIKMASIAIQRHPGSKWEDDCYLLVGQARYLAMDWPNAIDTYKFVNKKSKDPDARHHAIIGLIRTFSEKGEFSNGQAAIDYLEKEELNKVNAKNFALAKANFYQLQGNLDYMVRSLAKTEGTLKKRDRPGRIYFILGQVYQKLNFESEAYGYYKRCIATNPSYEIDFYARLYMAQVTEISRSRNVAAARKSFKKLLKDGKNKDFKDKIYYEMGMFELKQKNLPEAIGYYNMSIRAGKNKQIKGESYLRLGEIYYDTLKQYKVSQAYYDSAIQSLPQDYENYAEIKNRADVLNDFVKYMTTIEWQDSLLVLSTLDSATIWKSVDSSYQVRKKLEEQNQKKKKKKSKLVQISSNTDNNSPFASDSEDQPDEETAEPVNATQETGDWYFYNPSAMSTGMSEFRRIWGDIQLEDNWRRSLRSSTGSVARGSRNVPGPAPTDEEAAGPAAPEADPVQTEFTALSAAIPRTEAQKKASLAEIEVAYYHLGDLYYSKLEEKDNAVIWYKKLLDRFPASEFTPEVLYRLYLIYKDTDPASAEQYASELKSKFPDSAFAKILVNPNYLEESNQVVRKQEALYKQAYESYVDGRFFPAVTAIEEAESLGVTSFTPQLELLRILIVGKTEDISQYQYQLAEFSKKYAGLQIGDYAKSLLETSHQFLKDQEKRKGIQYIRSLEEPHYFVLVYKKTENLGNVPTLVLEKFNSQYFKELRLKTSNLALNDDYLITLVAELPRISSAIEYTQTFSEKLPSITELRNHKFHNFVITKDNFDIFYRTKGLDEYIYFFEKNYPLENP